MDWEDLRHFIAVASAGTLSGAARALQVDHATVSRRLAALEQALQLALVDRQPRSCTLTPFGRQVLAQAQAMEEGAYAIERLAQAARDPLDGQVSLSATPVLVAQVLARHLADFSARHPTLRLSVSAEARQVSLKRREADVALRLVRPKEPDYVARRIGQMPFGLYASIDYAQRTRPAQWQFIAYDAQQFAEMPQQQWLLRLADGRPVACELGDISGHLAAARAGAGVAGLPRFLGDADASLRRLEPDATPFSRDIWLLVHRDLRRSAPVRAVMEFVVRAIEAEPALGSPA